MTVENPILKGFNPDPSIIRVDDDYYIATSTFEWFPGIQIHHSKDLVNWELITRPLDRVSLLDLKGVPDSCGVWAPCLSYHEGTYYLVYSNTKSFQGTWKDTPNYLITSEDIHGKWSEPVFLSSMGFDGSLFHDDDGRKWYVSIHVDHRNQKFFGGIALQEYDPVQEQLIGVPEIIFPGTELGITEGPHVYKIDGYYYLITAEGGTEYNHAVTVARSKDIYGPYEVHPQNPIVTAADEPKADFQRTGHADIVEAKNGNWYIVFLASRPLKERDACTLGRETVIEELVWKNGWPTLSNGSDKPRKRFKLGTKIGQAKDSYWRDDFESEVLNIHWQSLRVPFDKTWIQLKDNQLILKGRESPSSKFEQSLVARRVQHFNVEVITRVHFNPTSFQHMAGLIFYYNTSHFHYLHITSDLNSSDRLLRIITCNKNDYSEPIEKGVPINQEVLFLKGAFEGTKIQFYYSLDGNNWITIGPALDGSILSDDYVRNESIKYQPAFTGAFVGLCCQDLSGSNLPAFFDFFEYNILET